MRHDPLHQPIATASAPGKFILHGEHAVVYGVPAIACPVAGVSATAHVYPKETPGIVVDAIDLNAQIRTQTDLDHPLSLATNNLLAQLGISPPPGLTIKLQSTIPIAAGLGSGASITTALIRALAQALGKQLTNATVSDLVFEIEKLFHGTPSGIDNTVVAYAQPVWFIRDQELIPLKTKTPFHILIGDTGIASETVTAVAGVRQRFDANPDQYQAYFDAIAALAHNAREIIETGNPAELGLLFNENHRLLQRIGVSNAELDTLVNAAKNAGALGAKLSGGGLGGNMIALVTADKIEPVTQALQAAGATRVIHTQVQ